LSGSEINVDVRLVNQSGKTALTDVVLTIADLFLSRMHRFRLASTMRISTLMPFLRKVGKMPGFEGLAG
jgi:hypothetical protein